MSAKFEGYRTFSESSNSDFESHGLALQFPSSGPLRPPSRILESETETEESITPSSTEDETSECDFFETPPEGPRKEIRKHTTHHRKSGGTISDSESSDEENLIVRGTSITTMTLEHVAKATGPDKTAATDVVDVGDPPEPQRAWWADDPEDLKKDDEVVSPI